MTNCLKWKTVPWSFALQSAFPIQAFGTLAYIMRADERLLLVTSL